MQTDPKPRRAVRRVVVDIADATVITFRIGRHRRVVPKRLTRPAPTKAVDQPPAASVPGLFLSPRESAIWHTLAEGPMTGKALARASVQKYTASFRTLLYNLCERRVIVRDRTAGGYRRAGG